MENVAWRQRLECCGHKPRHVKSHQKLLGEVRNGFSCRASGGGMASDNSFQTFGLQNYERQQFICNLLQQPQGTNVNSLASTRYDQASFFTINP